MQWSGASWLCWSSLSSVCSSSPSGAPSDRKVTSSLHKHLTCGDTLTCGTSPSEEMEEVANIQAVERVSVEDKGWFTLHQHQPGSITHSNPSLLVFGAVRASMNKNWIKESSSWCYKVGLYKILYDGRNITCRDVLLFILQWILITFFFHVTAMKKHWVMWKYIARFEDEYRVYISKKCKSFFVFQQVFSISTIFPRAFEYWVFF